MTNVYLLFFHFTRFFFVFHGVIVENIPLQSITILLCQVLRNTCPFNTYYFAKYYYIPNNPIYAPIFSHSKTQPISHKTEKA